MILINRSNPDLIGMYNYLKDKKEIGIDIETTRKYRRIYSEEVYKPGLDPHLTNILTIQIGTLEEVYIIDMRDFPLEEVVYYIKPILENKNILKIGHNLQFENLFFIHIGIRMRNLWDTFIAEKILYNGHFIKYSLEALCNRYLAKESTKKLNLFDTSIHDEYTSLLSYMTEEEAYQEVTSAYIDKGTRIQFINWGSKPFTKKQLRYMEEDITFPLLIKNIQQKGRKISNKIYKPIWDIKLESNFTLNLAQITYNGIPVDVDKWKEVYEINKEKYNQRLSILNNYVCKNFPEFSSGIDLFTNVNTCSINWASSQQVLPLFKELDLAVYQKSKSTGKMAWTVGAATLLDNLEASYKNLYMKNQDLEITNPSSLCLAYLLFKKSEQLITTFGIEWLKYIHPITKKIHPRFNQYMITNRLSSNSPNCLSMDTEVLTKRGWIKGNDLNPEEEVASWKDGKLKWEIPISYYKGRQEVTRYFKTHYDMALTPNHRCLFRDRKSGKYITKPASNFLKDSQVILSSYLEEGIQENPYLLKLVVAIQADAYITSYGHLDFGFTKERKYKRLINILKKLKISYTEINDKKRYRLVIPKQDIPQEITTYLKDKKFTWSILNTDINSRTIFFEELRYWDGNIKKHSQYTSRNKQDVDVVMAVGTTLGKRIHYRDYKWKGKIYPTLDICHTTDCTGTANTTIEKMGIQEVWCIKVPSGYFLARRNNLPFVTGNCQQIPNGPHRECFVAPKGYKWLSADYAQQEIRVAAEVHNNQTMKDFFLLENDFQGDYHSYSATNVQRAMRGNKEYRVPSKGSEEFTKEHSKERNHSKTISFLLQFGGGAYTLAKRLGIEEEEAEKLFYAYFEGFPGLADSFKQKKKFILKYGYSIISSSHLRPIEKLYFFPYHDRMQELLDLAYSLTDYKRNEKIPEEEKKRLREETEWSSIWKEFMIYKGKAERRGLNTPVQGNSATMTKLAIILLQERIWKENLDLKIILPVHDELNNIGKSENSEYYSALITECMVKAGEFICKEIPMEADCEVEDFWKH